MTDPTTPAAPLTREELKAAEKEKLSGNPEVIRTYLKLKADLESTATVNQQPRCDCHACTQARWYMSNTAARRSGETK